MANPNEFFTLQSMATFAGATGATMVITNGMSRAFRFNPRWFGLLVAQVLCLGIVANSHFNLPPGSALVSDYFVAVVNGFLVYCSAAGVTGAAGTVVDGGGGPASTARRRGGADIDVAPPSKRRFLEPWF